MKMSEETKQQRKQARAAATARERQRRGGAAPPATSNTPTGPITTRCEDGDHHYCARSLTCHCHCHNTTEISPRRPLNHEDNVEQRESDNWVTELRNNIRV